PRDLLVSLVHARLASHSHSAQPARQNHRLRPSSGPHRESVTAPPSSRSPLAFRPTDGHAWISRASGFLVAGLETRSFPRFTRSCKRYPRKILKPASAKTSS